MADATRDIPFEHESVLTGNVRQARIARVYAESLYALAARDNRAEAVGDEMEAVIRDVLDRNRRFGAFFVSPALGRRARGPLLAAAFEGKVSPLLMNFIGVLNQNNRLDLFRAVAAAYRELLDQRAGRVRVQVRSAVPLGDAEREQLRSTLAASLHKEPVLSVRVDPDLIGGLVVQVGDKVFDSSVRSRLDALRTQLLARGTHGTQA